jgi:hypothetical protein
MPKLWTDAMTETINQVAAKVGDEVEIGDILMGKKQTKRPWKWRNFRRNTITEIPLSGGDKAVIGETCLAVLDGGDSTSAPPRACCKRTCRSRSATGNSSTDSSCLVSAPASSDGGTA